MRAPLKWALLLAAVALLVGQASATTIYDYTQLSSIEDPSLLYGVGTTPTWWGNADDFTASLDLASVPVVTGDNQVYYGVGIAPEWWSAPIDDNAVGSGGWRWTKTDDYMSLWVKNRPNEKLIKELVIWWTPTEEVPPMLWKHVTLEAGIGSDVVAIEPVETEFNSATGGAYAKWFIRPQPSWEKITFTSCSHPSCDVWVGFNCAPGLPAIALVGAAPVIGMVLRKRRG